MRIKKDLVVVALATFCLTATLFMIIPTRSKYDPWADLKEDGTIDIYDAIMLANAFGTSGDPTKNVSVTNWPQNWRTIMLAENLTVQENEYYLGIIQIAGFSRMKFFAGVSNWTGLAPRETGTIRVHFNSTYTPEIGCESGGSDIVSWYGESIPAYVGGTYPYDNMLQISEPYLRIWLTFSSTSISQNIACKVTLGIYLRNE